MPQATLGRRAPPKYSAERAEQPLSPTKGASLSPDAINNVRTNHLEALREDLETLHQAMPELRACRDASAAARTLLGYVSAAGVDLSLVGRENPLLPVLRNLSRTGWSILRECSAELGGLPPGSPLESLTLPNRLFRSLIDDQAGAVGLLANLGEMGVKKISVYLPPGTGDLRALSGIVGVQTINIVGKQANDKYQLQRGVAVMRNGKPVPESEIVIADNPCPHAAALGGMGSRQFGFETQPGMAFHESKSPSAAETVVATLPKPSRGVGSPQLAPLGPTLQQSIRDDHFHDLLAELKASARARPEPLDEKFLVDLAHQLLKKVTQDGVDFGRVRPHHKSADSRLSGRIFLGVLLGLNSRCWDVLRKCHNTMRGRADQDAPFEYVGLPPAVAAVFTDKPEKGEHLVRELNAMGVKVIGVAVPDTGCDLRHACTIAGLRQIVVTSNSTGAQKRKIVVLPDIQVTSRLQDTQVIVVGRPGVNEPAASNPPPRVMQAPSQIVARARAAFQRELVEQLGQLFRDEDELNLDEIAGTLLRAVGESAADFTFLCSEASPFGVPPAHARAIFLKLNENCWHILMKCREAINETPLDNILFPENVASLFVVESGNIDATRNLVDQLAQMGVTKLTLRLDTGPDNQAGPNPVCFDLRSLSAIPSLKDIVVVCPQEDSRWWIEVPRKFNVSVLGGERVPDNWVRYWETTLPPQSIRLGDLQAIVKPFDMVLDASTTWFVDKAAVDPTIKKLADALSLHKAWGMVGADEVRAMARRLLAWASSGHLDFNHPPKLLGGVLEIVTPGILQTLQEHVAKLRPRGIEKVTLSAQMTRSFLVPGPLENPRPAYGDSPARGLTEALHVLTGLNDIVVSLPDTPNLPDGRKLELDLSCFDASRRGGTSAATSDRLFIHLMCPPGPAPRHVHVRAGATVCVINTAPSTQMEVHVHPWMPEKHPGGERPVSLGRQRAVVFEGPGLRTAQGDEELARLPERVLERFMPALVDALKAHHVEWALVRADHVEFKARQLLRWAATCAQSGHLDFAHLPTGLAGTLEIVTPAMLNVLQEFALHLGSKISEFTLSRSMSLRFLVTPHYDAHGHVTGLPLSNDLTEALGRLKLKKLNLELPGNSDKTLDARNLGPSIHITIGAGQVAARDVYIRAGTPVAVSSVEPSDMQLLSICPWDGAQFQHPIGYACGPMQATSFVSHANDSAPFFVPRQDPV